VTTPAVDGLKGPSGDRLDTEDAQQFPGTQGRPLLVVNERLADPTGELNHAAEDGQFKGIKAPN